MRVLGAWIILLLLAVFACAQDPNPEQIFREAREAQQRGDNTLAARKYEEVLKLHPENIAAHANLGVVLASQGHYDDAITQYHLALAQAPGTPLLRLDLGLAYYKKGDFAGAAAQFASLHKEDASDVRMATLLANCQIELGLPGQAVAVLQPLEKDQTDNLDLEWALGRALIRVGQTLDGLQRVQKVAEQGNNAQAYQLAADLYLGLTFFDVAKRDAEALLRLNPNSSNAYIVLGMIDDYAGDPKSAAEKYEKAVQISPDDLQARVQLASALIAQGKYDAARPHLDKVLAVAPNAAGAHYQLAKIEEGKGNLAAALKELEIASQADPQWISPHVELSALYYRLKRPTDGAREKATVDQLRDQEQKRRGEARVISPHVQPQ
jgi:tetratricopeptide (TPR) repeat protein